MIKRYHFVCQELSRPVIPPCPTKYSKRACREAVRTISKSKNQKRSKVILMISISIQRGKKHWPWVISTIQYFWERAYRVRSGSLFIVFW